MIRQMSVLDSVTESLASLRADVPAPDRVRLEQYFDDLREIERRLRKVRQTSPKSGKRPAAQTRRRS